MMHGCLDSYCYFAILFLIYMYISYQLIPRLHIYFTINAKKLSIHKYETKSVQCKVNSYISITVSTKHIICNYIVGSSISLFCNSANNVISKSIR